MFFLFLENRMIANRQIIIKLIFNEYSANNKYLKIIAHLEN